LFPWWAFPTFCTNPVSSFLAYGASEPQQTRDVSQEGKSQKDAARDLRVLSLQTQSIQVGLQGGASESTIIDIANKCVAMDLNGILVWYSSVYDATRNKDAFVYSKSNNAYPNAYNSWAQALAIMNK